MKKILRTLWIIVCITLISIYILSSLSSFISPAKFSYISLFAVAFPYVLAAFIVVFIISFFTVRRLSYVLLAILPLGYFNFTNTLALRKEVAWHPEKDSSAIRIMTWNVQGFSNFLHKKKSRSAFKNNMEEMLATIHDYDPDVICFQEYRNIENAKRRIPVRKQLDSLGYTYHFCSNDRVGTYTRNAAMRVEEGVAIYSKIPFIDSARININPSQNEHLVYTDVMFNNKPVRIFTAHLQSFAIYGDTSNQKGDSDNIYEITYKRRKAIEYKIRETEVKHQDEVSIIRNAIDQSPHPVIYCGDLNTTPTSFNYRYLKGNNLQDAFLEKGSGIGNTFYKICPTLRIDVCFADKKFKVQQCIRVKKKISDHYPVITDLGL